MTTSSAWWGCRPSLVREVDIVSANRSNGSHGACSRLGNKRLVVLSDASISPWAIVRPRGFCGLGMAASPARGSGADEYSSWHQKEELSACDSLRRRSEALIGIGHPKLECVSKIDPASSAFFRESGHERGDRLEIADPCELDREVRSIKPLRHRFGHAPPRIERAREHLLDPCLGEHLRDSVRRPAAGRRIRRSETNECRETGVGEGAKAAQPGVDRRRPGFQQRPRGVIECWDGHADLDLGELREKVEIPNHERGSRENGHRPPGPQEHFESVAGDSILPLDELVGIRCGRDRDEASGKLPYLLPDNRRRVSLHDDGRTPLLPVHPHQARRITKYTGMVTAYIRIERVIDSRERILAQGGVDRHFTNLEALARRGNGDA